MKQKNKELLHVRALNWNKCKHHALSVRLLVILVAIKHFPTTMGTLLIGADSDLGLNQLIYHVGLWFHILLVTGLSLSVSDHALLKD